MAKVQDKRHRCGESGARSWGEVHGAVVELVGLGEEVDDVEGRLGRGLVGCQVFAVESRAVSCCM